MESLYRKYRPQTFDDVVGQKHVVATLRRAVVEGRTSHAYLFCGPRGTGKTTMARLLAKALLCEQGAGHLPDGTCEQCRLIASGEHPDVYELDAASNTGVDNVREEIINRVGYAPVRGSYKVYIIDEVHMLTPAAFNALLKTLEEPPEHVVFVMCTTDPQKILETILSRVQRFDFRPISNDELYDRLVHVCDKEGFTYDREALELVTLHARGGLRDALSDLERLATYAGGHISLDAAQDMLGEVPASTLSEVCRACATRDVPALFDQVASLVDGGRDLLQFTRELTARLRDLYVVAAVGERPGVVSAQGEALAQLGQEARAFGSHDRIARAMALLGDASSEMRTAPNQRLVLELAFTRIARPETELTLDSLAERVAVLEGRLAQLEADGVTVAAAPVAVPAPQEQPAPVAPAPAPAVPQPRPAAPKPQPAPVAPAQPQAVQAPPVPTPRTSTQAPAPQPARPASPAPAPRAQAAPIQPAPTQAAPAPAAKAPGAVVDPGELQRRWRQVCDELLASAPSRGSLLMNSSIVSDDGETLLVTLPKGSTFAVKMLERQDVRETIAPVVGRAFGPRKISYSESSLKGADIARAARPAAPAPVPAPAPAPQRPARPAPVPAPPPQPAPQPMPAPAPVPAPAPQPQPAPKPAPVPQPASPYPAPWDEPAYDEVPYTDADTGSYEEDEYYAPAPLPPAPAPQPVAKPVRQPEAPQPAAPKPAPAPQPAPVAPKPAPAPQPEPAPQPAAPAQAARSASQDRHPQTDEAAIFSMLTDIFGEGVTMSKVEAPEQADEVMLDEEEEDEFDGSFYDDVDNDDEEM